MTAVSPTEAEIEAGLARYSELKSSEYYYRKQVPPAVADVFLPIAMPQQLYGVLGPPAAATGAMPYGGRGPDGFVAMLAECEPNVGPPLHVHQLTYEVFFVARGRFRVEWGDEGEHSVELGEFDTVCIPPGCYRRFENISEERGFLFVVAYGHEQVILDSVYHPSVRERILESAPEELDGVPTEQWLERPGFSRKRAPEAE